MARVSHELRTPLNAVIGFSDVMNAELFGPVGNPRYREYARHIRDSGRELLKSAEDTLAITSLLAHAEPFGAPTALDLKSLAADAWTFFVSDTKRRTLRLEIDAPEGLVLLGERRPLRQILVNLFSEAIERAADGGLVALAASVDGDLVQLEVTVGSALSRPGPNAGSLAMCMARALLELQGATLVETSDEGCGWRAVTVLGCATQQDFFEAPAAMPPLPHVRRTTQAVDRICC
jgi:hypothetical protein